MRHLQHNPDNCTACTICVVHCPVAQATMKFKGPKMTGPAYERFRLFGFADEEQLDYCSNCKNCDISCPSGVPVSVFNMLARAEYAKKHRPPLRDWILGHSGPIAGMTGFLPAWLMNLGMHNPISRFIMDKLGIDRRASMPRFGSQSVRRELHRHNKAGADGKTVVLFPGCFINYYEPQVGLDMIAVLERAGYSVIVPEGFQCCGLPMVANGYADDALNLARSNTAELARWARAGVPVLTGCPSCRLMLTDEYHELFPAIAELGRDAYAVEDACTFIVSLIDAGELPLDEARPATHKVAYHAACHLRAQGVGRSGLDMLRRIPGLQAPDTDAGCCGISGSYGFKKGKYEIGMDVGSNLFAAIKDSGAPISASECGTCRVQMKHGSGVPAYHPITVLRHCLDRKPLPGA